VGYRDSLPEGRGDVPRAIGPRVVVVGSVNVDLVARSDRLPSPGETLTGAQFSIHDGGKGGNQAVAAARLGVPTAFVGAVGDDEFGRRATAALAAEGVELAGLTTVSTATGVALILVDEHGENVISVASGANGAVTSVHVTEALSSLALGPDDVVLVCHEIPTAAVAAALRAGHAAGTTTILNPAPAAGLDRPTFALADILTPNRGELATLVAAEAERVGRAAAGRREAGTLQPEAAARVLLEQSSEGAGVKRAVVVTLGSSGAVLIERSGDPVDFSAPPVVAVDTVGAGDAFNGALAAGLVAGLPLSEAAARAVSAATLATTVPGARGGMPTTAELEAFVRST
jgi:ribokinase